MVEPLVTIGIPVYNCERFIALAVKSVLNQSYNNFELIIIDDGSTDGTVDVLRQFNDPRLTFLSDGENSGIAYRLNQQIEMAKGKYFCRMDGDDIMFPDRLRRQIDYLESHQGVDVIGSSAVIIGDENEIIGIRLFKENGKDNSCIEFIHPTVCGKTTFFKKFKYRNELKGIEDLDLWHRSRSDASFIQLNTPTLFYRDPLVFKLKVYLFRQKQLRKGLYCWLKEDHIRKSDFLRQMFQIILKISIASLLHTLGKDELMISRRNDICAYERKKYFQNILSNCMLKNI